MLHPEPLNVPRSSLEEIFANARESFPNERCGWLTGKKDSYIANGVRRAVNAYDTKIHPTAKDRTPQTAFVISDKPEFGRRLSGNFRRHCRSGTSAGRGVAVAHV